MVKLTQEEFIERIISKWGDRWDLSEAVYSGLANKVKVICREHGPFYQAASTLTKGNFVGCSYCNGTTPDQKRFMTEVEVVWGDRWDYTETVFKGYSKNLSVICKEHGKFTQRASRHLEGQVGCAYCSGKKIREEDYLLVLRSVWGDRWDYSKIMQSPPKDFLLVCRSHGEFLQRRTYAYQGKVGCRRCNGTLYDTDFFVTRSFSVWGDRWDYSKVKYQGSDKEVIIICKDHGEFRQKPSKHLRKQVGCSKCNGRLGKKDILNQVKEVWGNRWGYSNFSFTSTTITLKCPSHGDVVNHRYALLNGFDGCAMCRGYVYDLKTFKSKAKKVWGDRWDYSKVEYVSNKGKVIIGCLPHGNFLQSVDSHLRGKVGCKKCVPSHTSKGEDELFDFIRNNLPEHCVIVSNDRKSLGNGRELDIYIPSKNIAFEFNGIYWHNEKFKENRYHYDKFADSAEKGIHLIQIWEDDWLLKREIVEGHVKQVLGVSDLPKIAARKTDVKVLPFSAARDFLDQYHIQGSVSGSVYLGLLHKEELVAVSVFKNRGSGDYELVRYATSANVQGGHSKLVKYFERNYEYDKLITFADLTFGNGNLYRSTGWTEDLTLPPDYSYIVGGVREHKFNYRKKRFKEDPELEYVEGLTERELAQLNGMTRIYDAGKIRFIKPRPNDTYSVRPNLDRK